MAAFRAVIRRYEAQNSGIAIELKQVSYQERHQVDTLLAAGLAPDLFRVGYMEVGRYAPSGSLIDLTAHLPPGLEAQFSPQTWAAVLHRGRPHALPHHTDTSAIFYNKTLFGRLGIKAPKTLEESWTWSEFLAVSRKLKTACPFAFAVNWTLGGSFRWLNFLYQHGGTLTREGDREPNLPSAESIETLRWTQAFFRNGLVPPGDSAHATEEVDNLFGSGVVGMYFDVGPQAMREMQPAFEWGVTFLPRDRNHAAELGGNAIGISRDCKDVAEAANFALFLTNESNMREFVTKAQFLPVRRTLMLEDLPYSYRPEVMRVLLQQSQTVPLDLAKTVTSSWFYRVDRVLGEQLDQAFVGGQSAEVTLKNIADEIRRSLRRM